MLVIPAIDLKGGKCVRLLRGDLHAETVYGDDPVAMGRRWVAAGARYLHVVDLDGAVSGAPVNGDAIAALCAALPIPIEVGGGVRTIERAGAILAMGADRVIFGTAALEQPEVVTDACRRFPGRVAVGSPPDCRFPSPRRGVCFRVTHHRSRHEHHAVRGISAVPYRT